MAKVDPKLLRVLDANFNRAKEGLRVCEDVCRFFLNEPAATRRYKNIRQGLTATLGSLRVSELIAARDIEGDVGKASSGSEFRRRTVQDIFYANSQRVKESIRVLEEFAKLINPKVAEKLKRLRYSVYSVERQVVTRF